MSSSQLSCRYTGSISQISSRSGTTASLASTQRRLHRKEFPKFYADLCHLQHSHPLQAVKIYNNNSALDIQGDRIKFDEWYPIISALSWDQSLHAVAIRLRHRVRTALESADTDLKARNVTKQPILTTKFVLYWMVDSLKKCLIQSTALTVVELEGIPMRGDFITSFAQGLIQTRSLQHLSLYKCSIGDDGAEVISLAAKDLPTLITLDLSNCELTELGAIAVSRLITHQKLCRYSEAWKGTLRYRDPDVEAMPGLRRLTLNNNPEIGDNGINYLTEEIRDDLWLRAFDVQETGLSEEGGTHLLHLIRNNPNLVIVDARFNSELPEDMLSDIMSLLAINNADKNESDYKWINRDVEVRPKKSNRCQVRPWGKIPVQSSIRLAQRTPGSFRSPINQLKPFTKSHSTLSQKDSRRESADNPDVDYLQTRVFELTKALNQEMNQKTLLLRENQQLKNKVGECELKIKELEVIKKRVVTEETLAALEKTLNSLAVIFPKDKNGEISDEDSNIPNLLANINKIIVKGQLSGGKKGHTKGERRERRNGRKKQDVSEPVIWEEEEEGDLGSARYKKQLIENKTIGVQKAQDIFAKILQQRGEQFTQNITSHLGKREAAEKPLTSSGEESSSSF